MAHQRLPSAGDALKTPHSVSLKVLRLSRPSLATQHPLPNSSTIGISPTASLAYPTASPNDRFLISPALNLPEAFGSAYVGETFSCTLCANNELLLSDKTRTVSGVRIQGDMQTPSSPAGSSLELAGPEGVETGDSEGREDIGPGESLQRILRFELKEEGNHVLAVTVTYTETMIVGEGRAASGRVRTFRKLYQFVAQQLLSVRTKMGEVGTREGMERYLLEAQLENMGEAAVSLEDVSVNTKPPFASTSLNWDKHPLPEKVLNAPVLNPRDVVQVAFLIEQQPISEEDKNDRMVLSPADTQRTLGQLAIHWRSALGDRGSLSTGWLTSRR